VSTTKPNWLMLFREIIAVYCENHTQHVNALYGENAELLTLNPVAHIVTTVLSMVNVYYNSGMHSLHV
jgi:hypothetical protein